MKRALLVLLWTAIIIAICIFPYPALFMGNSLPKQPKLSISERKYFEKLKKEQPWNEINRMYANVDSTGMSIHQPIPIDFDSEYLYYIQFVTKDSSFYFDNNLQGNALAFAQYIKDSICQNSPYLIEIEIDITYKKIIDELSERNQHKYYQFLVKKDSLYLSPKGY